MTGRPESLWRIAEWFTGDGGHYREIREKGAIPSLETATGQTVRVPLALLTHGFREAAAAAAPRAEAPGLEFSGDERGQGTRRRPLEPAARALAARKAAARMRTMG